MPRFYARLALVAVSVSIVGCGPSVPAEVVYEVSVPAGARHADARVLRDGTPIGALGDRCGSRCRRPFSRVTFD